MMMRRRLPRVALAAAVAFVAVLSSAVGRAEERPEGPLPTITVEPRPQPSGRVHDEAADLSRRLEFLEERIGRQRTHAEVWWWGFTTFYFIGGIYGGVQAFSADTRAKEADQWVGVAKAAGGVIRLVADPFSGIEPFEPADTAGNVASLRREVARGEEVLRHNADTTHPFGPWYAHAINVAVNGLGAVIVGAGFDGWQDGLISAGIGVAVGEVQIFTSPWEADCDLEEYEDGYLAGGEHARRDEVRWSVAPMGTGLQLNAAF